MSGPKRYRLSATRVRDGHEVTTNAETAFAFFHACPDDSFRVLLTGHLREVVGEDGEVYRLERKEVES